jgi:hypothetical protein
MYFHCNAPLLTQIWITFRYFEVGGGFPKLPEFLLAVPQFALQIGTNQFADDFTPSKQHQEILRVITRSPEGRRWHRLLWRGEDVQAGVKRITDSSFCTRRQVTGLAKHSKCFFQEAAWRMGGLPRHWNYLQLQHFLDSDRVYEIGRSLFSYHATKLNMSWRSLCFERIFNLFTLSLCILLHYL